MTMRAWAGATCLAALVAAAPGALPETGETATAAARVRALVVADKWREALDEAKRAVAAVPGDPDAVTALGEALYRAGHIEDAGRAVEPIVAGGAPPARALAVLGLVRSAQGRADEGAGLMDRALALAPEDRWVVYQAAGAAPSRAETVRRLERYLALSAGDDPDRIEGARGTIRTNKALGERPVWISTARPDRVEVPLRAIGDGAGGITGYVVEASVGEGRKVWVLLDSGSGGLFVVERAVRKAAPEPLAEETIFAGGGSGRDSSKRALLPAFSLGGLAFKDAVITITPREIEPTGKYLGVLGLAIFDGYRITLDLKRGRLVLERDAPPLEGDPYWEVSGQMLVETGAGQARGLFLLDTGASRSVVSTMFAESVPGSRIGPESPVRTYGGKVPDARAATGIALEFRGLPGSAKPKTAFDLTMRSRLAGVEISGFLGLDVLSGHVIVIDTVRRKIRGQVSH